MGSLNSLGPEATYDSTARSDRRSGNFFTSGVPLREGVPLPEKAYRQFITLQEWDSFSSTLN
jgi:hypothetical protein